ncbi:MAG: nucleoside recognition domain-containing protein [Bacteroidota bacterium]
MVLNYIWISFFLIAFAVALIRLFTESNFAIFSDMLNEALSMAEFSVMKIALPLAGVMIFWMGMMKIAENSGMVNVFARWMWPFFKYIFPEIPKGHPASGSMMMNFSANMLGLDNAATPLGIKAMKELQTLNPSAEVASNSQIMFLVLNTSGLTIIPTSIIALRASSGSAFPTDVFLPILLATICSTLIALITVSVYQRINLFKFGFALRLFAFLGAVSAMVYAIIYFSKCLAVAFSENISGVMHINTLEASEICEQCASSKMAAYSSFAGAFIILVILVLFISFAASKKINVYDSFIEGAREGFSTVLQIIPYLVAMLVGIALFRTSGAMDFIIEGVKSFVSLFTAKTEFTEALPTAFMRPLSGGGSRALMIESWNTSGIDSLVGHMTSVIQGSTETTFYTIAVYYGAVGIRKVRHTIACGLMADAAGITAAIILSYLFFGQA